jgi:3-hydroxyacyl-CoA dehydrogenase
LGDGLTAGPARSCVPLEANANGERMRIGRIGVVGAGVMGSGIAALAASAGVPVVLLDVPGPDNDRAAPARLGLERALKARPAAFMDPDRAALVRTGTIADDLELLADCDLVIEAIIEQLPPKRELFERLEKILPAHAIIASNTSGIPIRLLAEGRSQGFRERFLGMHFFNPPRYLHLLELIPTAETSDETLRAARRFSERVLGKGTVVARDVPGFVANRLGVFGMFRAVRLMEEMDLGIDEVDALTGQLIGRPKSATFRTADITGIDVLQHVATGLSQSTGEDFSMPPWVAAMIADKRIGEKGGAGFYRKAGKEISTLDWKTQQYHPQRAPEDAELAKVAKLPSLEQRLHAIRTMPGKYGEFVRALLADTFRYVLEKTPELAYDVESVDRALEWGFGWDAGPFRTMDMLGHDFVREAITKSGKPVPPLLERAGGAFYQPDGSGGWTTPSLDGSGRRAVAPVEGSMTAESLHAHGAVLSSAKDAALLDMGDGVALLQFRSKMNTLGEGVLRMLQDALEQVAREGRAGLVIGNDDARTFSAGANLGEVGGLVQAGDWKKLEEAVRIFQGCSMAIRQAPFPVVVAPAGLALGGGTEFSLHADRIQAHAELYMGLVEVGVGLLPGGGGTKELLFRFTKELEPYEEADPFEAVKRAFRLIAMATTSTSALDARKLGFLRAHDRISMNRDTLLADAKQRVLDLAPDYVAPLPQTIRAVGRDAIGNLYYALFAFHEAGQASEHDVRIGRKIAYVLCGGDGPPRTVTEQDVLDLEREAFLELLGTRETQERIAHMLKTGKPLRN